MLSHELAGYMIIDCYSLLDYGSTTIFSFGRMCEVGRGLELNRYKI